VIKPNQGETQMIHTIAEAGFALAGGVAVAVIVDTIRANWERISRALGFN